MNSEQTGHQETEVRKRPLVSVMISTHNRAEMLRESAQSVLCQTFTDFELILCDDASTDETPQVCRELQKSDSRVRILRHARNIGMVPNWNSGLTAGTGTYFCKLDDDNRYLPEFLQQTVMALQQNPQAAFVFTDEWFIDARGDRIHELTEASSRLYGRHGLTAGLHHDTQLLAARQSPGINSSVFVRSTFLGVGGFRAFGGTIADLDVFLNLANQGHLACYIPQRLAEYRTHSGMGTSDLMTNEVKAQEAVAMWDSCRFQGEAERVRRRKLATAYTSLSRVRTLTGDVIGARQALREARRILPWQLRANAIMALLSLPTPLVEAALRARYGHIRRQGTPLQSPGGAAGG